MGAATVITPACGSAARTNERSKLSSAGVGLWFKDLFNYDFSVIGMDAVRTALFPNEISFCAYNSAGWRQVIEHVYQTATLAEWHRSRGRHRIYTNGAFIPALSIREGSSQQQHA